MANSTTFVGIDAHKKSLYLTISHPDRRKESFEITNTERSVKRLAKRLRKSTDGKISACYEAGPLGYVLQRMLIREGIECSIIAPSLIPFKPGEKIKTDRRDSQKLVELFRAGLLTEVFPMTPEQEAVRELCRAREDAKDNIKRAKQRMGKFLLRKGIVYTEGKVLWTQKYMSWLRKIEFEIEYDQQAFIHHLITLNQAIEREDEVTRNIQRLAETEPYKTPVGWLCCLHGIRTISAMTILSELHSFFRFKNPRQLMSYLGMTPGEHSSGEKKVRSGITKSGNSRVRRILVEAAWNHRRRPISSAAVRLRRDNQPGWVVEIACKAQARLYKKYSSMILKGKHQNKAAIAVGRELIGFIWAILSNPQNPYLYN